MLNKLTFYTEEISFFKMNLNCMHGAYLNSTGMFVACKVLSAEQQTLDWIPLTILPSHGT